MRIGIIGAGICGLYIAWKLAERGEDITVFEKKTKIGKDSCSGLFSQRILKFIPQSKDLIQNQINYCLIHFPRKTLKIKFSEPFLVMNHSQLDKLVFQLATEKGARILLNSPVRSEKLNQLNFEKIIGCDGAVSVVRKYLGLSEPDYRIGIQGFRPENSYFNFVETWPTRNGFCWKIPRGAETEYGIIESPKMVKSIWEKFLEKNNLRLKKIKSAFIPQGLIACPDKNITLCGDSSGLTKPWSGGGVVWALIAADMLLENFPDFQKYQKKLKRFFLPKIIFSKTVTQLIYFLGFNLPWVLPKYVKIENDFLI